MSDHDYEGYWVHDDYKQAMNDAIFDQEPTVELTEQTATKTVVKTWEPKKEQVVLTKENEEIVGRESWDSIWAAALKVAYEANKKTSISVPSPETNVSGPRYWLRKA